jgi:hypothetical protein
MRTYWLGVSVSVETTYLSSLFLLDEEAIEAAIHGTNFGYTAFIFRRELLLAEDDRERREDVLLEGAKCALANPCFDDP